MKKTFDLHLDAAIVITLLFVMALGMNLFQYLIYEDLVAENFKLQMQGLENQLNLDSMKTYLDGLDRQAEDCPAG